MAYTRTRDQDNVIFLGETVTKNQELMANPRFKYAFSALICQAFCHPDSCTRQTRLDVASLWDGAVRNGFICC